MAKFLAGPMASEIKGSSGGTVFSRNRGGAYIRSRVKGVNPNTPKQRAVRANFGSLSKGWGVDLGATDRDAWTFFGQGNPVVNSLGQSIILSGNAWYNKLNRVLDQLGLAALVTPPPNLYVNAIAAPLSITVDSAGPAFDVTTAVQALDPSVKYYVFATGGVSAGRIPPAAQYRFIGAYATTAAATDIDLLAAWQAAFGAVISGRNYGVRISNVSTLSGAVTPFLTFTAIAT